MFCAWSFLCVVHNGPADPVCCRPNCVAKLVDVQGQHRVFIFTMQEIAPLEELT